MECDLETMGFGAEAEMHIDVQPMFLTKTPYFYGLTADSDPKITIDHAFSSNIEGDMNAKDHSSRMAASLGSMERGAGTGPTSIKIKFQPAGASGEFTAYLCFILPEEKSFSKFYKITGKS